METSTDDGVAQPGTGTGSGTSSKAAVAVPPASLSPSRAGDFMQCPLLYRFRVIDKLPEKPSEAATRGTLVHSVLERLFDAPATERTVPRAKSLIPGQWDRLRTAKPELAELFADADEQAAGERLARWLAEAEQLVERWFTLEDPTRLEPAERELFVEARLESGLKLRGIIDRVDVAPTGEVRIVDYKTGKAPRPEYAEGALFQMKFYALVVWRLKKVVPRRLQLVYLGSGDVLTYDPVVADLERVESKLHALWDAIRHATETGDWRPRPTKLCGWCDHQAVCPEFGGTPPPYPLPVRAADRASAGGAGAAAQRTQPLPARAAEPDPVGDPGVAAQQAQSLPKKAAEPDPAGEPGVATQETQPLPATAASPDAARDPGSVPHETQSPPTRAADPHSARDPGVATQQTPSPPKKAAEPDPAGEPGVATQETQPLPATAASPDAARDPGSVPHETQSPPTRAADPHSPGGPGAVPREAQTLPVRAPESGRGQQGRMGPD